jgi:hypothetical protein
MERAIRVNGMGTRILTGAALMIVGTVLSGCPPVHPPPKAPPVHVPAVHAPEPPSLHTPEPPPVRDVPVPPVGSVSGARSQVEQRAQESDLAFDIVCEAVEFSDDADQVRSGTLSQAAFVAKYRAKFAATYDASSVADVAFSIYGLLTDIQEGDPAAISTDLACY